MRIGARLFVACGAMLLWPALANAEPVSAATIVELTKVGLGDDAIIAKIKSDGGTYELSADEMIELKKQGVSSAVIAAMLSTKPDPASQMSMDSPDPMIPHPSGVYLFKGSGDKARMQRIDSTASSQAKTGGIFGYALTGGLASASVKVAIQKETALARSTNKPRFFFFFDQANTGNAAGTWASGTNTTVSSPAEFTLIRLKRKDGRREARVGSRNIGGTKTGVMDKDRVSFHYEMVRPGVYEVKADKVLKSGEYGFIFSLSGGGSAGAMTARIFDFTVS